MRIILGGVVLLAGIWWHRDSFTSRELPPPEIAIVESLDNSVVQRPKFLGPDACSTCHAQRVAEFKLTRHFQACMVPGAEAEHLGFTAENGHFVAHNPTIHFKMTRRDGKLIQTAIRTTTQGEQRTDTQIAFAYGHGASTDEIFLAWHGDELRELPMAWLHPLNQWGASPFSQYDTGDFSRAVPPRCLECHNTWIEHFPGSVNRYRPDGFVLGVTCEVCHGSGQEHVSYHQSHPETKAAQAIVHPGRLSRQQQLDLCAQCHSNAAKYRKPPFSYRPGEPLDKYFKTLEFKYPEEDRVANQQYLLQSKCFQNSESMTCITCHNPHRPSDRSHSGSGQSSCLSCHQSTDCGERPSLPVAVQNNCVGCHMPKSNKIQVHFRTETDSFLPTVKKWEHRIAVYPAARDEVLLEWYRRQSDAHSREETTRLARSLAEYWLTKAENHVRDYRYLAAIDAFRQSLQSESSPATRDRLREIIGLKSKLDDELALAMHQFGQQKYSEAMTTFTQVLSVKPDLAGAHGTLGTLYAIKGKRDLANDHLRAVAKYDPNDPYGESMLGWLAYLDDRLDESLEHYQRAEEIEPYDAKINYQIGLVLMKLQRQPEAAERFKQVLTSDPQNVEGCHAMSLSLRQQGRPGEAIPYVEHAVKVTGRQNVDLLVALAETYSEANRYQQAIDTATSSLRLAQRTNSKLLPRIQALLIEVRSSSQKSP